MTKNSVSRRAFIQYLATTTAAIFVPQKLMAGHQKNTTPTTLPYQHDGNSEFVIIDGWVLLKKDLEE